MVVIMVSLTEIIIGLDGKHDCKVGSLFPEI